MAEIVIQRFIVEYLCGAMTPSYYFYNIKVIIINCVNGFCETSSQVTLGNTQNMVLTFVSTFY
jgi:hypothetical protein